MEERYEIKVNNLSKVMCKIEYEEKLKQRLERVWGKVVGLRREVGGY